MNKYRLYLLPGVIIFNTIDYISICTDVELFIIYVCVYFVTDYIYYRLYLLPGVIIFNIIDYISICTDVELFIIYMCVCVLCLLYVCLRIITQAG